MAKWPQPMTAEGHVVHHGDPEPRGAGGHHVGVEVPGQHIAIIHHEDYQHNCPPIL